MKDLLTVLSAVGPLGLIVSLWVMAQISRRFGEVTHRPPLYRLLYVALILAVVPLVMRLLAVGLDGSTRLQGDHSEVLLHDIPLAISLSLSLGVGWRYWGWLVYAHEEPDPNRRPES